MAGNVNKKLEPELKNLGDIVQFQYPDGNTKFCLVRPDETLHDHMLFAVNSSGFEFERLVLINRETAFKL